MTSPLPKTALDEGKERQKLDRNVSMCVYLVLVTIFSALLYNGPITVLIQNETAFVEDDIIADDGN